MKNAAVIIHNSDVSYLRDEVLIFFIQHKLKKKRSRKQEIDFALATISISFYLKNAMATVDFGIAWNWEFDKEFVYGIEHECSKLGLTTYRLEFHNIQETLKNIRSGKLRFRTFLDRASDEEEEFLPFARYLSRSSVHVFNSYEFIEKAKDKATMHLELLSHGVDVPYTIIISPYQTKKEIELSLTELAHLGRPFIIKPANTTGGGIGVVTGAETLKEIINVRQHHKSDKYLLQETIIPKAFKGRKAWFRVLYTFDEVICCWWDPETHIYQEVSKSDFQRYSLEPLITITQKIYTACQLDFFSTEIALAANDRFVTVDYVNEICDMRPQSTHFDGVPNNVIHKVQQLLAQSVMKFL